jgi:hypothetical protein
MRVPHFLSEQKRRASQLVQGLVLLRKRCQQLLVLRLRLL